jgi:diguanylate cyclase (GGDEF)-like protein/PAS domain S-box-containing protein
MEKSYSLQWFKVFLCLNIVILTGVLWEMIVTFFSMHSEFQYHLLEIAVLFVIDTPIFYFLLNKDRKLLLVFVALIPIYEVSKIALEQYQQINSPFLDYCIQFLLLALVTSPTIILSLVLDREYKHKLQEIKDSEERYSELIQHSPDMIAIVNNGIFCYVNDAALKLLGATHEKQIIGKNVLQFIPEEQIESIKELINNSNPMTKWIAVESKLLRLDQAIIDVEVTGIPVVHKNQPSRQLIIRDITEQKKTQEKIKHMAFHDSLTGLPNRNYFYDQLTEALNVEEKTPFAVIFIDLDRFKYINDSMGHDIGDLLLQSVADRLKKCIRNTDVVARQGGDEFIVLLRDATKKTAVDISKRILNELAQPHRLKNYEVYTTPSIGISLYPDHGETMETLVKHADAAMYKAKERGKNNFQFFSADLHENIERKMLLEKRLRHAVDNNEFSLCYQPQVNLKTNQMVGVEALLRWQHPQLGYISPVEFIPLAEEIGLINNIGEWVLREACSQAKKWHDAGYPKITMSVNVSAKHLKSNDFVSTIRHILYKTRLEAKYLKVEITEGSVMENAKENIEKLNELKELGVRISIDDFGTGYSSLNYLKLLPIHDLKIDKSFIRDIVDDPNNVAIAKAIIDLGRSLNLNVIAEGVEHKEQLKILLRNHCEEAQGFYFSKPLTAHECETMFQNLILMNDR